MKTVFIFDSQGEAPIQFFTEEGDFSHLDGVYINGDCSPEAVSSLNDILFPRNYADDWSYRPMEDKFPVLAADEPYTVIIVGFIP